jgi:protein O-GlcNAc transferase
MKRKHHRTEKRQNRPIGEGASLGDQRLVAEGLQHHMAGRLNDAERLYRQVLAVNPRHADSLHLLGMIAYQTGQHQIAADKIRKAIAINGGVALYHCNLGNVLIAQGKLDESADCYRTAITLNPDFPEAHYTSAIL